MYIVITGNPVNGFVYTGPFKCQDDAIGWADETGSDWWITELNGV